MSSHVEFHVSLHVQLLLFDFESTPLCGSILVDCVGPFSVNPMVCFISSRLIFLSVVAISCFLTFIDILYLPLSSLSLSLSLSLYLSLSPSLPHSLSLTPSLSPSPSLSLSPSVSLSLPLSVFFSLSCCLIKVEIQGVTDGGGTGTLACHVITSPFMSSANGPLGEGKQ